MPITYEPIASVSLTGNQDTITFSSIPNTYTDLRMVASIRLSGGPSGGVANEYFQFNGDTGSNYSRTRLQGNGATASAANVANSDSALQTFTPGQFYPGFSTFDIFSYAGSTFKTVLWKDNADTNTTGGFVCNAVGVWRSTAAINSITWRNAGDTYGNGTKITLYGILRA